MMTMATSVVQEHNSILKEARNADELKIKNGKDLMVYVNALKIFPTFPSDQKTVKSKLARVLINAWKVICDIDSLFNFFGPTDLICNSPMGQWWALNSGQRESSKIFAMESSQKSIDVPKEELLRKFLEGGCLPAPRRFQHCVKCGYSLISLPPMNTKILDDNKYTMENMSIK